jgi:predicted DNA-binding transcriptional regulator YafY
VSELVRLYRYKELLGGRRALSADALRKTLEISPATLKRDIAKLRDQLHMPIRFDKDRGGYVMDSGHTDSELPGMWFSPEEVLALVTIQQLLTQLAPGMLGAKLKPLQARLAELMAKNGLADEDVSRRIRLVHAGRRLPQAKCFEAVAAATMGRKRLSGRHFNRQTGETLTRTFSPQRLVHYRDNWYVDSWCHLRDGLRSFSVDALADVEVLLDSAEEIDPGRLDQELSVSYGIFSGAPVGRAVLRFSPSRSRWVSREQWHPAQESWEEQDGSFVLSIPYSDDRELLGDVLRYGADVQVVEPEPLRRKVQKALLDAAGRYV